MWTFLIFAYSIFVFDSLSCGLARGAMCYAASAAQLQDAEQSAASNEKRDASIERAKEFIHKGLWQDAKLTLREYLSQHSDSADGHFLLGYVLFKEQSPEASLAEYTEGAKYHDPDPSDLKIVALNYVLLNDYSDADHWLTLSVEGNPKDSESWYYLGRTKYNRSRLPEAIRAFEECLRLDPNDVKAKANLGLALQGLGRIDEALEAYRSAIAMEKHGAQRNAEPFIDLGNLLLEQNQIDDAIANLSEAREISPSDPRVHESLGKAYLRIDKFSEAQAELEKAASLAPNSAPVHYMLGQVYRKRGLNEKAKAEFDRAAILNEPKSPPATPTSQP